MSCVDTEFDPSLLIGRVPQRYPSSATMGGRAGQRAVPLRVSERCVLATRTRGARAAHEQISRRVVFGNAVTFFDFALNCAMTVLEVLGVQRSRHGPHHIASTDGFERLWRSPKQPAILGRPTTIATCYICGVLLELKSSLVFTASSEARHDKDHRF